MGLLGALAPAGEPCVVLTARLSRVAGPSPVWEAKGGEELGSVLMFAIQASWISKS